MRGLLTWDPEQRLGSSGVHQIMQHPFFATVGWSRLEAEVQQDQQLYAELQVQRASQKQQQPEQLQEERELQEVGASYSR